MDGLLAVTKTDGQSSLGLAKFDSHMKAIKFIPVPKNIRLAKGWLVGIGKP